jgi:hypothetical protein
MPVFELFSSRKKQANNAGKADVYQYETIPHPLKVQIAHVLRDSMGNYNTYHNEAIVERWEFIHDTIAREKGVFQLGSESSYESRCINWLLNANNTDDVLDFVEFSFRILEFVDQVDTYSRNNQGIKVTSEEAISELNARFKQNGVGYRFENNQIVRIDSQYIHSEITKPALSLLQGKTFETANEEFMSAHRHYRNGEYKDCATACQRAFESTLKAICTLKKWDFDKAGRLSDLLKAVRARGLPRISG